MNLNEMIWIDLPLLRSITLGDNALCGGYGETSSMKMGDIGNRIRKDWL